MAKVKIEPVLRSFKGWNVDTTQVSEAANLPQTMNEYVHYINDFIGAPVHYVSNGPGRKQIVKVL